MPGPVAAGRARDVLDILLIDALGQLDYVVAADAARRVFSERATHPFPLVFAMPPEWRPELEEMAQELGVRPHRGAEIERRFLDVIRTLIARDQPRRRIAHRKSVINADEQSRICCRPKFR